VLGGVVQAQHGDQLLAAHVEPLAGRDQELHAWRALQQVQHQAGSAPFVEAGLGCQQVLEVVQDKKELFVREEAQHRSARVRIVEVLPDSAGDSRCDGGGGAQRR
jgi:hypothetical protein